MDILPGQLSIPLFPVPFVERYKQHLPDNIKDQSAYLIRLSTDQHGDDKEETNEHLVQGKTFLEKKTDKDR